MNGIVAVVLVAILFGATAGYLVGTSARQTVTATSLTTLGSVVYDEPSVTTVGSETFVTFHTTLNACNACSGGGTFTYPLSLNYSGGPWILHYWVQNYSGTQNSINGNLIGSGNSEIWITFHVGGYVQYTLCASATKGPNDSPQLYDLPLTLSSLGQDVTATNSNSTVETCGTMAV
jgi:hypothetical protein